MDPNIDNSPSSVSAWTAMQEMTNATIQNSQHPEMCANKFRKTLNDLVLAIFGLPQDADSGLVKLFNCITHCMEEFPQIFVIPKHTMKLDDLSETELHRKAVSLAFTKWLTARLFQLLSRPNMSEYHNQCTYLLVSLWKLLEMQDLSAFCCLTVELVSFVTELIAINNRAFSGINDSTPIEMEYFFKTAEAKNVLEKTTLNLHEHLIRVMPGSQCKALQIETLQILLQLVPGITQFVSRLTPTIWVICCHHIEKGCLVLKQLSLEIINSLRNHDGLPENPQISRYLADCVLALMEYICQQDADERDWSEIEKSLASIIPEEMIFSNDSYRMQKTATVLLNLITQVKSADLQKAIGNCIFQCITHNVKLEPPWETALIKLLGHLQESEWLVKSVYLILQAEMGVQMDRKEKSPQNNSQQTVKVEDTQMWKLIMDYLKSLDKAPNTQPEVVIQHCRCICEVLLLSIFIFRSGYQINLTKIVLQERHFRADVVDGSIIWSEQNLQKFYHLILWYIGLKLNFQVWSPLDDNWWVIAIGMLSLPWQFTAASTFDFPEMPYPVNAALKTIAETHLGTKMKAMALPLLATFPPQVAPHWRMHLLNNELSSKIIELQNAALHSLEIFLHVMGPGHLRHFESTLRTLTERASIPIIKKMAILWGKLSCIMSTASTMNWCSDKISGSVFVILIECSDCKRLLKGGDVEQHFDDMWKFFLCHSSSAVRLAMVTELAHVLAHTGGQGKLLDLCIILLEDKSYDVRQAFSKCMPSYWSSLKHCGHSLEDFVSHIKEAYLLAKGRGNWQLQKTILLTFGSLGKIVDGDLLSFVIVILLENLMLPMPFVSAVACLQIKEIATAKNIKTNGLFQRFCRPVSKFLLEAFCDAQERGDSNPLDILNNVVKVFDFPDSKSLLMGILPHILPHLVIKASAACTAIHRCLAKHLQVNKRELLVNYFKYIFRYLVCNCSTSEMEKALSYVEKETEIEIGGLLRCDCQRIYNELLLHIGSYHNEIFKGLAILASKDERYSNPRIIEQPEEMAEFLQPRFLGFLAYFDAQILNSNILLEDKQSAVASLVTILQLMGSKHITSVRMKVMTTLRIMLRFTDTKFLNVCCQAWDSFVHILNPSVIGPMLSQIIATLLPIFESCMQGVTRILNYLIIENKDNFGSFFNDLYFIPDVPELAHINAVLKEYQEQPVSQGDLRELLQRLLRGICQENLDVRLHALSNLKTVIATHQGTIQHLILRSDLVDPLVTQLVDTLLTSCRDADSRMRSLISQCLGQLGAIDPGRLDMKNCIANDEQLKIYQGIDDDDFAVDLVTELARCFLGAVDTRKQDCSSYAIQEVLHVYQCQESEDTSNGGQLWNRFPEHIQEVIAPLLHSRYVASKSHECTNMRHPIYFSSKGRTFHEWIKNWADYLIPKVRHPKASQIFLACRMIIRHDMSVALFLLPHILLHILLDGLEQDVQMIFSEIMAVLKNSGGNLTLDPDLHHMSVQAVFSVLDRLKKSLEKQTALSLPKASTVARASAGDARNAVQMNSVLQFLEKIPKDTLARASFVAQAYSRALMNLEAHIKQNPQLLQEQLSFLQELYAALDEPDGIAGVTAVRQETSLFSQILSHESSGHLQDALPCYEKAIEVDPENLSLHQGLLRCLMDLDQPHTALTYCSGLLAKRHDWVEKINHFRVEAAWKLTSWDALETYLNAARSGTEPWGFGIGRTLAAIKSMSNTYLEQLDLLRTQQMAPLSAASMENGSYQRGYQYIVRLQMLDELEKGTAIFLNAETQVNQRSVEDLLVEWGNRKQFVQCSMRHLEPVLNLRRVLLGMAIDQTPELSQQLKQEVGKCWLYSAKIARKCGHLQRAYSSLLTASKYNLSDIFLEQAKWHWQKGEQEHAISCLQKVIKEHYPQIQATKPCNGSQKNEYILAWAKTKLMLARYTEESGNLESNAIIQMYRDVLEINPEWEDGHFFLAQFYDRILCTTEHKDKRGDLIGNVVKHFGTSLFYGCRYVYQSVPRMISLWLEFGTSCAEIGKPQKTGSLKAYETMQKMLLNLNKLITTFAQQLPSYLFLTAFSQLISRICHAHKEVFSTLKEIIANLLITYPQQSMWMMMAVSKSSYEIRVRRCEEIFSRAQQMSPQLVKFLADATKLTDRLLELCNKKVETGVTSLSVSTHFQGLLSLLDDNNFSEILLPRQSCLMVTLPTGQCSHVNYEPFLHGQLYICGIKESVELMPSLQRPKKITLKGTDGKFYDMMCKPKDDLRKDCRLMEFNSVVNKFLLKDAESRKRQLHIRTYAVVPLNEECGLIEWVPNLKGLRIILNNIYKEKHLHTSGNELKRLGAARTSPLEQKIEIFRTKLLPRFPPVFSEWFLRTFSDPTTWYLARVSYARTTAVMSMVGYILGLGDRHGENILFDSSCGDTVHVDFNCLFNKGETFDWPELVPFRLTHNMVEAMGPLGYEGIYRKSCETTLRVMHKQIDTLMSLLKPFIHDPLLEWSNSSRAGTSRGNAKTQQGEIINEKAMVHVQEIEHRLKGIIKSKTNKTKSHGIPLSVEGQVNWLIQEATDVKNLSQMYIGWAAYM